MKTKAYSYTRFSSGRQIKGRSLKRQTESPYVLAFIKHHNLEVVQQMIDPAVSGFRGKNFSNDKALGKFVEQIRQGNIEKGSVLIVENLDRFSRDNITDCIKRFTEIIEAGVSVGVVAMNIIIDLEQVNTPLVWNYVSNEFQRARAESKRKSDMSNDILQDKVNKARAGELVYFSSAPTWIDDVKDGQWILKQDKVALVKRIYKLYLEGVSGSAIATLLNKEKVPTLRANKVGTWFHSHVKALLCNRNVIGYCNLLDFEKDDYYPQIISPVDFQKVAVRLGFNSFTRGGARSDVVPNVFRGLMFCECGNAIDCQQSKYKETEYYYAYCRKYDLAASCSCKERIKMNLLELAIFSMFKHPKDIMAKPVHTNSHLTALNNKLAAVEITIARLTDTLTDPDLDLPAIKAKLKQAVASKDSILTEIAKEKAANFQVAELPKALGSLFDIVTLKDKGKDIKDAQQWTDSFSAYIKDANNRKIIRNMMPTIFERIVVSHKATDGIRQTDIDCTLIGGTKLSTKLTQNTKTGLYELEQQ